MALDLEGRKHSLHDGMMPTGRGAVRSIVAGTRLCKGTTHLGGWSEKLRHPRVACKQACCYNSPRAADLRGATSIISVAHILRYLFSVLRVM